MLPDRQRRKNGSRAWWNARGCLHLIVRSFGILRCVGLFVYNPAAFGQFFRNSDRTSCIDGLSKAQIRGEHQPRSRRRTIPIPEAGAMSYMLSKAELGIPSTLVPPFMFCPDNGAGWGETWRLTGVVQRRISRRSGVRKLFSWYGFPWSRRTAGTSGI